MNDAEELFDGAPSALHTQANSFGISAACYLRMAECARRAMEYGGVQAVSIRRLRATPGCELTLYGKENAYTLVVAADTSPASVGVYCQPLDSCGEEPGCELVGGFDEPSTWHRIAAAIIWREGEAGSEELLEWQEISDELSERNGWPEGA
jgi:hypothetical protein